MPEILIVKECFGIEQALHQLTALEYSCTAVQNREEASELLHHQMYDLVLLGIGHLEADLLWIEDIAGRYPGLPVIAVGNVKDSGERIRLLNHGAWDCIPSSCSSGEITARVKAFVRRREKYGER